MVISARLWWVAGAVLGLACGASSAPPKSGSDGGKGGAAPAAKGTSSDDGRTALAAPTRMPTAETRGKDTPPPATDDMVDVSLGQCADLEATLGRLIFDDLKAKIDPKLEGSVREKSEKDAADNARKTAAQFGDNCRSNMAGKAVRREMLGCLFKSKSFSAFEGCLK